MPCESILLLEFPVHCISLILMLKLYFTVIKIVCFMKMQVVNSIVCEDPESSDRRSQSDNVVFFCFVFGRGVVRGEDSNSTESGL